MKIIMDLPEGLEPGDAADLRAAVAAWARKRIATRTKTRAQRFPGIVARARALGVSRIHLYYVLTGERRSPRIEAYIAEHMRQPAS